MSDPYNQQYGQQQGYDQGGYGYSGQPQPGYGQGYPPQQGGYPPQHQGYQQPPSPQPGYQQQAPAPYGQQPHSSYQGYGGQPYAPPSGYDQFGPPQHGGFQHGQAGGQFGQYDASHPQGQPGYYGDGRATGGEAQAYHQGHPQEAAYGQGHAPPPSQVYDANGQPHDFPPQSSDKNAPNYDPKAPPMSEGERGLLGSIGGAAAGHYMGKSAGHGFLGTIGGAIMGNILEDKAKKRHGKHGKHSGGGSSHGSSWGGKW